MNNPQHAPSKSRAVDIDRLISRLSPELQDVAKLRIFEGLTYEGVADRLGCPMWKVRKLVFEMLGALRELCGVQIVQIAPGYEVRYLPHFLPGPEADSWLARLLAALPFQPEHLRLYGKDFVLKRQTTQYGRNYDYNPAAHETHVWCPPLTDLKITVEQAIGMRFQSALCNLYPDGRAYIGWHRDAGQPEMIVSLSLGAVRELRFAQAGSSRAVYAMELGHGSLLLIPESVNDHFKHMVPKNRSITQLRINVTFRSFARHNGILSGTAQSSA
jgi:alkylated DNA repair dioxygenase AlkB